MEVLHIILYVLGAVCLGALTVLIIKLTISVDRINSILDDVEDKMKVVDNVFSIVDKLTDSLSSASNKIIDGITYYVTKLITPKKKKTKKIENKEE